jgi:toxin ParE1/3/4
MSLPEFQLELSPRAQQDIVEILRHTGYTWGREQLLIYRDQLDEALRLLSVRPDIGHPSDHLPATYRLYPVGSHVIVYRTQGSVVGVARILHQRMNWTQHLP